MKTIFEVVRYVACGLVLCVLACGPTARSASAAFKCDDLNFSLWTVDTKEEAAICLAPLDGFDLTKCKSDTCQQVASWRRLQGKERASKASEVLTAIRDHLAGTVAAHPRMKPLQTELDRWLLEMKSLSAESLLKEGTGPFRRDGANIWHYDAGSKKLLENRPNEVDLGADLASSCTSPAACTDTLRGTAAAIADAQLVQIVGNTLFNEDRDAAVAYLEETDQRWSNYFSASRFQYPWELLVNSARFKGQTARGIVGPPTDQVILLHPSAGFRYGAKADRSFEPALFLELAGYYKWRWDGGEAKDVYGGSLMLSWVNEPTAKKIGYGFLVHLPKNWSIGLVYHETSTGHATSIVVGADIAKLFENPQAAKATLLGTEK